MAVALLSSLFDIFVTFGLPYKFAILVLSVAIAVKQ